MIYWIILTALIVLGIYDLYRYFKGQRTVTQKIHDFIKDHNISVWPRLGVTIGCFALSWYLGGETLFIPVLVGWLICHLIGWDF